MGGLPNENHIDEREDQSLVPPTQHVNRDFTDIGSTRAGHIAYIHSFVVGFCCPLNRMNHSIDMRPEAFSGARHQPSTNQLTYGYSLVDSNRSFLNH